ncbi:hypothetical protein LCGC14_1093410 [marine sediment metagenome]|uniref:Uncharacterized protein n=1 Tax=marine sediment metagenome TaxID=412755 RepID=A0A0F9PUV7_9ZZZZ
MLDSKGNYFYIGNTLVSSKYPDTDSGIICIDITGKIAYFEPNPHFTEGPIFCLNQKSLDRSK